MSYENDNKFGQSKDQSGKTQGGQQGKPGTSRDAQGRTVGTPPSRDTGTTRDAQGRDAQGRPMQGSPKNSSQR